MGPCEHWLVLLLPSHPLHSHPLPLPLHPHLCLRTLWFQLCLGQARGNGAPGEPGAEATRGWKESSEQRCVLKSASFWPRLNFQALGLTDRQGKAAGLPVEPGLRCGGSTGAWAPGPAPLALPLYPGEPGAWVRGGPCPGGGPGVSTGKCQNSSKSDNSSTINKGGQHLLSAYCLFFKHMLIH